MSIEDPGELTVTCDDCGEDISAATTEYSDGEGGTGGLFGVDSGNLESLGWLKIGDSTFCPKCKDRNS